MFMYINKNKVKEKKICAHNRNQKKKKTPLTCLIVLHLYKQLFCLTDGATLMSQMEQNYRTSKQKPNDHMTTVRCGNHDEIHD